MSHSEHANVTRGGPGRPKQLRTGQPGRPKKQYNLNYIEDLETPQTAAEALSGQHAQEWQKSMQTEYDALIANGTWSLVELPEGHKAIGSKWEFRIKRNVNGDIERFKSRLVAKGCGQQRKAIYGLKQYGRVWNNTLDEVLKDIGFNRCKNEPCLYVSQHQQQYSYIAVYVGDLIIMSPSETYIARIKKKIASKFQMQDGGAIRYFLSLEVQHKIQ
ncbi:PREDICTED: uncharacterized protein LOC108371430 [Rhagoletis zephyria]|uniref:uncharacterized protein LOC108371430 n=1 Tax=Rhagoletis zephyria TaxID=28612 RepID=UPI0008119F07|nr:PREDICTED: uncharacterized protein LOC108371430 [Rhagoletis zephyria]